MLRLTFAKNQSKTTCSMAFFAAALCSLLMTPSVFAAVSCPGTFDINFDALNISAESRGQFRFPFANPVLQQDASIEEIASDIEASTATLEGLFVTRDGQSVLLSSQKTGLLVSKDIEGAYVTVKQCLEKLSPMALASLVETLRSATQRLAAKSTNFQLATGLLYKQTVRDFYEGIRSNIESQDPLGRGQELVRNCALAPGLASSKARQAVQTAL